MPTYLFICVNKANKIIEWRKLTLRLYLSLGRKNIFFPFWFNVYLNFESKINKSLLLFICNAGSSIECKSINSALQCNLFLNRMIISVVYVLCFCLHWPRGTKPREHFVVVVVGNCFILDYGNRNDFITILPIKVIFITAKYLPHFLRHGYRIFGNSKSNNSFHSKYIFSQIASNVCKSHVKHKKVENAILICIPLVRIVLIS